MSQTSLTPLKMTVKNNWTEASYHLLVENSKVSTKNPIAASELGLVSEPVGESPINIFDDLPHQMPKEVIQTLIQASDVPFVRENGSVPLACP
jgi:hypothetical protein